MTFSLCCFFAKSHWAILLSGNSKYIQAKGRVVVKIVFCCISFQGILSKEFCFHDPKEWRNVNEQELLS